MITKSILAILAAMTMSLLPAADADNQVTFPLDARSIRYVAAGTTDAFTYSANAWGAITGDGTTATVSLNSSALADWTALAGTSLQNFTFSTPGTYTFAHTAGDQIEYAIFYVTGIMIRNLKMTTDKVQIYAYIPFSSASELSGKLRLKYTASAPDDNTTWNYITPDAPAASDNDIYILAFDRSLLPSGEWTSLYWKVEQTE